MGYQLYPINVVRTSSFHLTLRASARIRTGRRRDMCGEKVNILRGHPNFDVSSCWSSCYPAWTVPAIPLIIASLFVLWLNLHKSVDCFESLPNRLTRSFSTLYEGYTVQSISSWTSIRLLVCLLVQTVMPQRKSVSCCLISE
jgi:hypothetical protein